MALFLRRLGRMVHAASQVAIPCLGGSEAASMMCGLCRAFPECIPRGKKSNRAFYIWHDSMADANPYWPFVLVTPFISSLPSLLLLASCSL